MARAYGRTPWELAKMDAGAFSVNLAAFRAGTEAERDAAARTALEDRVNRGGGRGY